MATERGREEAVVMTARLVVRAAMIVWVLLCLTGVLLLLIGSAQGGSLVIGSH